MSTMMIYEVGELLKGYANLIELLFEQNKVLFG